MQLLCVPVVESALWPWRADPKKCAVAECCTMTLQRGQYWRSFRATPPHPCPRTTSTDLPMSAAPPPDVPKVWRDRIVASAWSPGVSCYRRASYEPRRLDDGTGAGASPASGNTTGESDGRILRSAGGGIFWQDALAGSGALKSVDSYMFRLEGGSPRANLMLQRRSRPRHERLVSPHASSDPLAAVSGHRPYTRTSLSKMGRLYRLPSTPSPREQACLPRGSSRREHAQPEWCVWRRPSYLYVAPAGWEFRARGAQVMWPRSCRWGKACKSAVTDRVPPHPKRLRSSMRAATSRLPHGRLRWPSLGLGL